MHSRTRPTFSRAASPGVLRRRTATLADERWQAVAARDPLADGGFVYSVRTTGVYCRPSCGARAPRPENVAFHDTAAAAERAGFRACKRCRPDAIAPAQARASLITELCREIAAGTEAPRLSELAARAGMSASNLHRLFLRLTGLSPRAYAAAERSRRVRRELGRRSTVTAAIHAAGYGSSSRFYETAARTVGMAPAAFRDGGAGAKIRFAVGTCSLGAILVAASDRGICAVSLGGDPGALVRELAEQFPRARVTAAGARFKRLMARVVALVEAPGTAADLPLDVRGTAFEARVWRALARVPAGRTLSYSELARRIRSPRSVRAVARACAANRLAVLIPCHRAVRRDGGLAGYRWGVERKRELLAREAGGRRAQEST